MGIRGGEESLRRDMSRYWIGLDWIGGMRKRKDGAHDSVVCVWVFCRVVGAALWLEVGRPWELQVRGEVNYFVCRYFDAFGLFLKHFWKIGFKTKNKKEITVIVAL